MAILTEKYIRKPLYVDAVQVSEENFVEIAKWCQGEIRTNEEEKVVESELVKNGQTDVDVVNLVEPKDLHVRVRVHNPQSPRQAKAFVGDWLLYTPRGYKVYTQKAFQNAFDPA